LLRNPSIRGRIRELQEAVSADVISLEITARNSRAKALQKRWHGLRAGLDLILDQRGADMADLPGGSSGMLCRDYKGRSTMSQALNRLRTMVSPPEYSSPMPRPPSGDRGWMA
jgi:hypothetical protein